MPHVVVKIMSGRTEEQKQRLAAEVTKAVMNALGSGEESISVAVEDVPGGEWTAKVYDPEIRPNMDRLYKKPGYTPG